MGEFKVSTCVQVTHNAGAIHNAPISHRYKVWLCNIRIASRRIQTTVLAGRETKCSEEVRHVRRTRKEIHDIHARADRSENGMAQSGGAMVNYLYDLTRTERNHEGYARNNEVTISRTVRGLTSEPFLTQSKDLSS